MLSKTLTFYVACALFASVQITSSKELPEYTAIEAAKHVGETAMVTDKVDDVYQAKGNQIFLNMGGKHPNHVFTAFIPGTAASAFKDPKIYKDKIISVTGKIEEHKGKPEITIKSPSQITSKVDDLSGAVAAPAEPASPSPAATSSPAASP